MPTFPLNVPRHHAPSTIVVMQDGKLARRAEENKRAREMAYRIQQH